MKNMKISWGNFPEPCYNPQAKYGKCPETFLDLLNDERIPCKDKVWAFSACTIIPDAEKYKFACRCIRETKVLDPCTLKASTPISVLNNVRYENALAASERFAAGTTTFREVIVAQSLLPRIAHHSVAAAHAAVCSVGISIDTHAAWWTSEHCCDRAWGGRQNGYTQHVEIIKSLFEQ